MLSGQSPLAINASATITVVQIPHNGSRMGVVKLPLMPTPGFDTVTSRFDQHEHHLSTVPDVTLRLMPTTGFGTVTSGSDQHECHLSTVPDVRNNNYAASRQLARTYRELVDLGDMDPEQNPRDRYQRRGPYYMYKLSVGARRHLPGMLNEHFSRAGAHDVYGTAFIFKVKQTASQSQSGALECENLDQSFIDSAFKGRGLSASESLRWLSRQ